MGDSGLGQQDAFRRAELAADHVADVDVLLVQEVLVVGSRSSAEVLACSSGMTVVASAASWRFSDGRVSGTAVLSRLPGRDVGPILLGSGQIGEVAAAEIVCASGRTVLAISAHLEWGPREHVRLAQARSIDAAAREWVAARGGEEMAPVILGGDLNCYPDADTVRFLTGRGVSDGEATLWLDAWDVVGEGPGFTSRPGTNPLIAQTAHRLASLKGSRNAILDPSLLPDRRLDYVFVRDWAHGRAGCPLSARVEAFDPSGGAKVVSDHERLVVDLWDPPVRVTA